MLVAYFNRVDWRRRKLSGTHEECATLFIAAPWSDYGESYFIFWTDILYEFFIQACFYGS